MQQIQEQQPPQDFNELVKNLYATKKRELTQEKLDYIKSNYKGREEEFVKNFYATIGEELPQEKFDYIRDNYLKKKSTSPSPSSGMPSESVFGEIEKTQRAFDADRQAANKSLFGFQQPQEAPKAPKVAFDPLALEEALTNTAVTDKASRNQVTLGQGVNENIPVRVSDQLKSEAKKFQEISDRMIVEATPVLEKAIKPFLAKGLFTDKNGNVLDAMIDRFALTLSKNLGMESGVESLPYVKEFLRGFVKNKEEAAVFQQKASKKVPGQLQKILGSKLPTAKLAGKDVPELSAAPKTEAEYIKTELDKAAAEQANLLIQTANSQNKTIQQEYKKQEAAVNKEYEPLFKSASSQEEFNALTERYYTAMGGIRDKANRRLQRQQGELNKSIQSKLASLDLPEAAKKNLQDAWLEAGKQVQEEDLKGKKAMQDAFVELFGFSGLFGKALASSLLTGLASRGDGLVGIGMGGQVADWLRTFREPGLELETVDLELKGQNWYNPQSYVTRLGKQIGYQAPGMIASAATGNPFLGGIIGWGDENLQNAGETYSQVLSETNNPMLAQRAAKKYLYTSAYTIPLYFVESEMFLRLAGVKKGGNFFQNTAIDIPIENIQEGIQGYTGQLDYKDAKTLGAYLKKDFPDVALETTITTVLQNALFAGVGKVGQSLATKKITPEEFSRNYVYNLVANKGLNTAFAATELKFSNGLISKEQLAEWKSKITEVASTVETLKGLGLSDEQVRGYVALQAKRDELQNKANSWAGTGIVDVTLREEIEKIDEELKKAALGKVPSTTVTFPSGGSVTITGDEAKQTAEELKGEAGTTVDVTTTEEAVQKEIEEVKKKVPEQTNDELFDKMTDLQQMFYENGVEARVDDNGVVTVQDMNGQEVDIDILPDDVINGINEYKDIFKQLRKEETPKAEEAPKTKGDVGVIGAPQEVSLMDNLNQVVTSLERLRGQPNVTQDMVVAQMAPITDQMASIEKEFAKQGFIIDVDYDTVVIRKDSKEGQDYTQPEDLPKPLQKLAAEYEMAALELLGLDETSFGIALQKSKGVTEDVPYEEVSTAKDSDEEGKPLGSFGVGDIVYTNYPAGKKNTYWNYTEYKIEEVDAKGNYKLKDVKRNVIVEFPAKQPGFILKEKKAEETKTKPKNPKTNTAELDKALEDFIGEKPKGAETPKAETPKEPEDKTERTYLLYKKMFEYYEDYRRKNPDDLVGEGYEYAAKKMVEKEGVSQELADVLENQIQYLAVSYFSSLDTFKTLPQKGLENLVQKTNEASQPSAKQPSLESAPVVKVPVSDIKENVKEYQGRKNKFSERSAANVAKNFDINKFDPIVVFKHPDGNTYVLSGHSRLEGMRRRGEKTIPARFFTGTTEEAKEFALKSNKLGTLQTDLENAAYYREAMQKGKSLSSLMAEAKETEQEGTATRIMDYAMLNPKGKAYQALESLEGGESDSSTNVKIIAQKVGRIRAKNDHLTDAHENELFDYFLENGYPTDKDVNDPANVLNRSINAVKFDPKEPLNLSRIVTKSPERVEWERELKELESQLAETNRQVTPDKKTGWTGLKESIIAQLAQGKTQKDIDNAEKRFNENAGGVNDIYKKKLEDAKKKQSVLKDKLAKHKLREKSLIQGEKSQTSLFDAAEDTTIEDTIEDTTENAEITSKNNDIIKQNKIEGELFNEQQSIELQKEIESKYSDTPKFGLDIGNEDIRTKMFNYNNPLAEKDVNGVNLRIAEGFIEENKNRRRKTYLLYADGKIVGKFYSVDDIKKVVKFIEDNLIKGIGEAKIKTEPKKEKRKIRDEKLKKDIDDALDDLFGSSSITLTSFGIDPERLEKGVKIIGLYTKAGLYKFKDIAEDLYEKYGEKLKNILEEIKAVYAYYRIAATKEEREQMDVDVADFTYEQIAMGANEPDPKQDFIDSVESKLISKERQNIITLRKLAQALELEVTDQELQEYVELAIVNVARKISMNKYLDLTEEERFEEIKDLYQNQPTISMRSSERIEKQQYSTPVPISFTAGMFAQTGGKKTFLDPSAGNGMLLINVDGSIQANEIDRTRSENLERQGFDVTNLNGEEELPFKVDSVLTNPPFGGREKKVFGEFNITGLAPQMAINALNTMKDDGTAVVIVGGHAEYDERGVLKGGDRAFLNYLYQNYNVIDVINVDGSLYAKQGTSFPIRMILIGGRRSQQAPGALPGVREIKRAPLREDARAEAVKSFDELYNRVKTAQNELLSLQKVRKYELGQKPLSGVGNVGGTSSAGNTSKDTGVPNQPVQPSTRPAGRPDILGQPGGPIIRDSEQLGNTGNVEGLKEQPVDKVNIEKVQGGAGESLQLPGRADERIKEIQEAKNVRYEPGSKSEEIGSVVPANMAAGIRGVLSQFPDVDDFVRERLGYKSKEELFSYLSAEQVDGVAIAISQIENNKAVIIGDMTGVGKGRQAAAIIRYAVKQGLKPVFMTEKSGLFSDIYRDLINIGSGDLKPFIVNDESEKSDPKVYVDDGTGTGKQKVLHRPMQRKEKQAYYLSGALPKNVDFVLITYSQLAQEKVGKDKRNFFRNISIGNVLILDESHNASGEGKTGQFLQSLLPTTKGVTFLSATYSKNPDTMAVYGTKTSISEANMTQSELISAVKKGGAVLQEILSKQLTEIGEYVRRERDFEGVVTTWETAGETPEEKKEITDIFDSVADVLRSVLLFQRLYVTPAVKQMNEDLKNQQGSAGLTQGTVDAGVSNTPFASKVFNITRQLMFSLKAEKVAEAAIDEIKKGNKVVIAVSNTMEGFLEGLDFEEGVLSSVDYTVALQKALTGVLRYTVKSGGNQTTNLSLNVSQLSPEGQAEFRRISKQIKEITTGITISPIDVIKSKIQNAGYTIAEITGRSNQIIFNEEGRGELKKRKTDKKEAETGFTGGDLQKGEKPSNNSKYNAVVLNMSGSTGISLHASKTFRDQRPRVMIMAQMQLDVNTEIQVRGRIDRTGQVSRGRYRYILSPIPAENRLAMMFIKKLKSLSANTSGSQQTKEDAEIVDFLNKYGDEKVLEYLKESTEINAALFDPLKLEGLTDDDLEKKTVVDNAAHITSGRVALLSVKQQQDFYDEIASRYTAYIATLDANNENDLKAQILNLKSKTLKTEVVIQGKNNNNPFSEDSVLEEVEMDNNKFPLFKKEIDKQIQDRQDQGGSTGEIMDALNGFTEKKVQEEVAYAEKVMDEKLTELESLTETRKANAATEQDRNEIVAEYESAEKDMRERYEYLKESRTNRVKQRQSRAVSFVRKFTPGGMYLVPLSVKAPTTMGSSPGVFIGFALRSKTNLTPSNISARFAVLDSRRVVDVPLSQSEFLENVNKGLGMTKLENWDEERKVVKSRRKGYIITGNILQAANYPGKIIKYTTEDGQIKDGILMQDNFDPAKEFGGKLLVSAEKAVDYFLGVGDITDATGEVEIRVVGREVKIYVPKSKSAGGKYFLNEGLRNLVENRNFSERGGRLVGTMPKADAQKLFDYLGKEFGLKFAIEKPKPLASQKAKKSISEIQFNELVNRLKAAFPQAKIITKEEALQKPGGTVIKTAKGVIYGLTFPDGSIYLNSEAMSAEAAIHEFSHLWEAAFPQEWKNGIEMMRKSSGFQKALAKVKSDSDYAGLTPGEQESEALNMIIGKKGEGYFRNEALSNFKAWLRKLFVKIADKLGLGKLVNPDTSFEQFTDKVIGELLNKKAKTFTTSKGKPKLSSQQSAIDEFDNIMQSKNVVERQNMQYDFIKKYGVDKFKKLRDITLNFDSYVDQLEKDNYIKDKLC